jgi:hypothetical protein
MPINYKQHYKLQAILAKEPAIIPSRPLYNFNEGKVYAAMMDYLAQQISDGVDSPFSSRNPLSGHGQLTGMFAHFLGIFAHQMNLVPDRTWMEEFRMLGMELSDAEYPVIELRFSRSYDAFVSNIPVIIPLGTEVGSHRAGNLIASTTSTIEISGEDREVSVPARLNIKGKLPYDISTNEFTILPQMLSFVDSVASTTVLYQGRDEEDLASAMLRTRQQLQVGLRCTTARDYYVTALNLGAQKVNVIPGVSFPYGDYYSDLISVVVYPGEISSFISSTLLDRTMIGTRLDVIPAEIIPIDGTIDARIVPGISNSQAFEIAASAIQDNVNPPYGKWADVNFAVMVATALENQPASIYAVPKTNLKHAVTNQPLAEIKPMPWQLFEIQASVEFNWLR